jgi:hypothetical protein
MALILEEIDISGWSWHRVITKKNVPAIARMIPLVAVNIVARKRRGTPGPATVGRSRGKM